MTSEQPEPAGPDCSCAGAPGNPAARAGATFWRPGWVGVAVLALGLLAACSAPAANAPEPVRVSVLSYNIHRGVGLDGVTDLERIAAVIRASGADLVALQEVDVSTRRSAGVDQAAELARLTGMHMVFGEAMPYDGGQYGEAVLSRLPIASQEAFALPHSPRREPRCALAVSVVVGGRELLFVGTHLDHLADPGDRIAQVGALDEHVGDIPGARDLPTILAGDFNDEPGSQALSLLTNRWAAVLGPEPILTFPADGATKAIDHFFVRPVGRWHLISCGVIDEPVASDHLPVGAVLEFR